MSDDNRPPFTPIHILDYLNLICLTDVPEELGFSKTRQESEQMKLYAPQTKGTYPFHKSRSAVNHGKPKNLALMGFSFEDS
jgi:hypothetical protein